MTFVCNYNRACSLYNVGTTGYKVYITVECAPMHAGCTCIYRTSLITLHKSVGLIMPNKISVRMQFKLGIDEIDTFILKFTIRRAYNYNTDELTTKN